ncbi:type II secretion system protein [Bacillus sp. FJAT-27251]|uniref:type II secretion system protein n=1 Tax=Bacillus sp. FJAT-27251 TaxID=1684142 RepID=UPI000A8D7963|nr:type II secretion system protein [Bacillus sp. FJAT-27251]
MKNEQGITLVEVLATILILSIAGTIIWQVFFQGYQYSQRALSKNKMLQEVNIISTNILRTHQTEEQYQLKMLTSGCGISLSANGHTEIFDHNEICISFNQNGIPDVIKPNVEHAELPFVLRAWERTNIENKVELEARLYRMKGGNY